MTVIRVCGNLYSLFLIAARTRSLLSWMAVSVSPTTLKAGIPFDTSISRVTRCASSPERQTEWRSVITFFVIILNFFDLQR